ncbi:Tensin-3 [Toxocara canis]|uniref:Tensin-3 n=1 Tax=Toxocara canis TaxID=6265 RepID=A0A0B2W1V5_TOXCA|nr:Tensin-3 [Toxocara canis]
MDSNNKKRLQQQLTKVREANTDMYDPASRCFSYVPAKALNEHFTTPRKPMQWQRADEPSALDTPPLPSEIANVPLVSTDLVRRPETPKWDDEIDKIANEYAKGGRIETVHGDVAKESALANGPLSSAVNAMSASASEFDSQIEEKPLVIDQAKRATKRRKTKCGSYRTLNDDAYSSDMDDLCDPDFYLTYGAPHSADARLYNTDAGAAHSIEVGSLRRPASAMSRPTSKSVELPRRPFREISQRGRTTIDEAMSTPKPATSLSELNRERDAFRNRNCRSATSAPIYRQESRGSRFYDDRYDSLTDAENADDWLKSQLRKLKTKRENNPEMLRRKRQEKMLLEELKHANDDRQMARGRDERNYTVEGYGQRSDPLAEYRMEEERLRNTRSPYPERRDREEPFAPRRVMPPKSTDVVRHKPPTPPPRARSRSPPASPYLRRSYTRTPTHESAYQQERNNLNRSEDNELINDLDEGEFSHLRNIVQDRNIHTEGPSMNLGRSILKRRDVSNENSSPSLSRRGLTTPVEEWSTASINRAPTPSFPVRRETPLPYHPLLFNGACEAMPAGTTLNYRSASPRSLYYEQSRRTSMTSLEPGEIIHHHPVFVKDTSKYWYKPTISREEAINMLRDKPPGTFVVRDSNSFPGAFGLALKVATPPPGIHSGDGTELVRHFLIEPSPKGVKLKGCNNEPVFGTLSALVYQHSITPLALPTKLLLPDYDPASTPEHISAAQALLQQGAACNVTYIASLDTESLTGPEAVRRCIGDALELYTKKMVQPVSVHFKVSSQGVTVTDNTRRLFFRRHYPVQSVTFAGIDPADRRWDNSCISEGLTTYVKSARMFAFVARKIGSRTDNACHVFAELEPEQPASAVVNFITKVMMGRK